MYCLKAVWKKHRSPSRRDAKTAAIQHQHAWRRLLKRFGICLHITEIEQLVTEIQARQWPLIQQQSRRVSIYQVTVEGQQMAAAYDKDRHAIMTFLPLDWILGKQLPPDVMDELKDVA